MTHVVYLCVVACMHVCLWKTWNARCGSYLYILNIIIYSINVYIAGEYDGPGF